MLQELHAQTNSDQEIMPRQQTLNNKNMDVLPMMYKLQRNACVNVKISD